MHTSAILWVPNIRRLPGGYGLLSRSELTGDTA